MTEINIAKPETKNQGDLTPDEQKMLEKAEAEEKDGHEQQLSYDHDTQRMILSHLVLDPEINSWACGKVTPECFQDRAHSLLLQVVQDVQEDTGKIPTKDVAVIELRQRVEKRTQEEQLRILAEAEYVYTYCCCLDEKEWVRKKIANFLRHRLTVAAMFRYADKHHDLDELRQDLAAIEPLGECKWEDVGTFLETALAEQEVWLVDGRLPAGRFVMISGHEKAGKSVLTYHLLSCLLTGGDWLGMHVPAPVKSALVLNYENPTKYAATLLVNCMPLDRWLKVRDRVRWVNPDRLPHVLTVAYLDAVTKGLEPGILVVDTVMAALGPQFAARAGGSYTPEVVAAALHRSWSGPTRPAGRSPDCTTSTRAGIRRVPTSSAHAPTSSGTTTERARASGRWSSVDACFMSPARSRSAGTTTMGDPASSPRRRRRKSNPCGIAFLPFCRFRTKTRRKASGTWLPGPARARKSSEVFSPNWSNNWRWRVRKEAVRRPGSTGGQGSFCPVARFPFARFPDPQGKRRENEQIYDTKEVALGFCSLSLLFSL